MSAFRVTRKPVPSPVQRAWLKRGLDQPGGKLPLFDTQGQQIDPRTIQACIEQERDPRQRLHRAVVEEERDAPTLVLLGGEDLVGRIPTQIVAHQETMAK